MLSSLQNQSTTVRHAAYNAAADLAFVAPETMIPTIIEQIRADLSAEEMSAFGPTEAAIARTPEGITFVDVLASKSQDQRPDKSAKDYDVLKWEEDLRAQLAQKKGQQKKLTVEQQAKVNAQLAKEANIRETLHNVEVKLRRGIGFIQSLAMGPPTEAELWMNPAVHCLLGIISAGAALLVGDTAAAAFLACAERISPRLGTVRPFIGVAMLRALGASSLPREMEQEPLGGMLSPDPGFNTSWY